MIKSVKKWHLKVLDIKPANNAVIDNKPKNNPLNIDYGQEQFYTVVLGAGQSMGLLLSLTYPVAGTVQSSFSP